MNVTKPAANFVLNTNDPLTAGMVLALPILSIGSGGQIYDLVSNLEVVADGYDTDVTYGPVARNSAGASQVAFPLPAPANGFPTSDFTLSFGVLVNGTSGQSSECLFNLTRTDTNANPSVVLSCQRSQANNKYFALGIPNANGTLSVQDTTFTIDSQAQPFFVHYLAVYDSASHSIEFYNGTTALGSASLININGNAGPFLLQALVSTTGGASNTTTVFDNGWMRKLTTAEIARVVNNPYDYLVAPAAGNPPTFATNAASVLSATPTQVNLTVTAATGGTTPLAYQWYRGTTTTFVPGPATILSSATATGFTTTTVTDTPPDGAVYYYACVATDASARTATSNTVSGQVSAASSSNASSGVSAAALALAMRAEFAVEIQQVHTIFAQANLIPQSPAAVNSPVSLTASVLLAIATAVRQELQNSPIPSDLTQMVPLTNTPNSMGDALNAARAGAFGKLVLSGTTLSVYGSDGTTVVRSFALDSATNPTTRN